MTLRSQAHCIFKSSFTCEGANFWWTGMEASLVLDATMMDVEQEDRKLEMRGHPLRLPFHSMRGK